MQELKAKKMEESEPLRSKFAEIHRCLIGWHWSQWFYLWKWMCVTASVGGTTGSASDQQSTNDRKVAGSRPAKVVCITVLTGNRMGWTARCGRPPLLLQSCRKLEFRLSALMDSDLAWINGKNARQSWRYADAFKRSIISEAIYHFLPCAPAVERKHRQYLRNGAR